MKSLQYNGFHPSYFYEKYILLGFKQKRLWKTIFFEVEQILCCSFLFCHTVVTAVRYPDYEKNMKECVEMKKLFGKVVVNEGVKNFL